jgi:uncharacterized membrane protein
MTTKHRKQPFFLRHATARPRLLLSAAIGATAYVLLPGPLALTTRLLAAWDVGVLLYISLAMTMMLTSSEAMMRRRAAIEDEGRFVVLALVVIAATASLVAIGAELMLIGQSTGTMRALQLGLSVLTIVASWSFIHLIFTQHYAHEFYIERHRDAAGKMVNTGGLAFPGAGPPDYIDFLYFSFTIGVANQTADIAVTSREMRRLALIHSILAYLFNTTILALTINIATSQL